LEKDVNRIRQSNPSLHVTATGFRMATLEIILALKPTEVYHLQVITADFSSLPSYLHFVATSFLLGMCFVLFSQFRFSQFRFGQFIHGLFQDISVKILHRHSRCCLIR
jgi:hypothetical protein